MCKASQPGSGNQTVGFIAKFYTLVLTSRSFQSPRSDTQNFRPLLPQQFYTPFSILDEIVALLMCSVYKYYQK